MRALLIDRSKTSRILVRRALEALGPTEILDADTLDEGFALAARWPVDLVVAGAPALTSSWLAAVETFRRADAPLVALVASEAVAAAFRGTGAEVVARPFSPRLLKDAARRALAERERLRKSTDSALAGSLNDIGFGELLQFLTMQRASGRLSLEGGGTVGSLRLQEGQVRHAECGTVVGEPAFFVLAGLLAGRFRFERGAAGTTETITRPTMPLLMEAMRLRDERRT